MKITIGIKSLAEADYFLRRGADEIYFGPAVPSHRASFSKERELIATIELAGKLRKRSLLALNEIYSEEHHAFLLDHARSLIASGLDGIVVRDVALLEHFNKHKLRTNFTSSIMCSCFNSHSMDFYRDLGVRRFTLHSQVMPEDAARMVARAETIMFVPCLFLEENIVPFCFFTYPGGPGASKLKVRPCKIGFNCGGRDFRMLESNLYFQAGLLYDFHKLGVKWLKIPRQLNTRKLITEFEITRFLNVLLQRGLDRNAFINAVAELITRTDLNKYGSSYLIKPDADLRARHA
jgi:hypothetical protein